MPQGLGGRSRIIRRAGRISKPRAHAAHHRRGIENPRARGDLLSLQVPWGRGSFGDPSLVPRITAGIPRSFQGGNKVKKAKRAAREKFSPSALGGFRTKKGGPKTALSYPISVCCLGSPSLAPRYDLAGSSAATAGRQERSRSWVVDPRGDPPLGRSHPDCRCSHRASCLLP